MVATSVKYIVYTHTGTGVRHHHFGVQNNIINEANGVASPGDTLPALGFPTLPFMGQNVPFAFMSVHGAADGNYLFTSSGIQNIQVGSSNVDILVVYAPPGGFGGPNGGPGVWVDAFNVNTGAFSDSLDFIQVLTPPTPPDTLDNPKTTFANAEGVVSTLAAENLRANVAVDGGVPFLEWKRITPVETLLNTREVDLAQNQSNEIWFAFYKTKKPDISIPDLTKELANSLGRWGDDDYCGTPFPHKIGPRGPVFRISLPAEVTKGLSAAQKEKLASLSKEYGSVANTAYAEMTKVTKLLGEIGNIVSKTKGK